MSTKSLKVFIHPIDAAGHINACVGIGQALQQRGHEICFLSDISFKGQYEPFGFREILMQDTSNVEVQLDNDTNPIQKFSEMLVKLGMLSGNNAEDKIRAFLDQSVIVDEIFEKAVANNDQIQAAIDKEKPDLIIVDNLIVEPAILQSGIPWIHLLSANPIWAYNSPELPPFALGYPTNSDKETWKPYKEIERKLIKIRLEQRNRILRHFKCQEIPIESGKREFSQYLNIYGFPEELDYDDIVPRPATFVRVDAFCRKLPEPFQFPEEFQQKIKPGDKLIFVSMGSMGSFDVKLMKRLIAVLAKTSHKYIVSKGLLHDQFELADNMWGEPNVPQTSILPLVDLVITHGGNNSATEAFNFGKPMIVMPLFLDQYDNAQRIDEKGFGIRMNPYQFTEQELTNNIDKLLNDKELREKMDKISKRIEQSNSKEKACIAIEQMVEKHRKKRIEDKNN